MNAISKRKEFWIGAVGLALTSAPMVHADSLPISVTSALRKEDVGTVKIKAEQGDVAAQKRYAEYLEKGHRYVDAVTWYRKSAEAGLPESQYKLGYLLIRGRPQMSKDRPKLEAQPEEAVRWLVKAAHQDHGLAQLRVGQCYQEGEVVSKNLTLAYAWFSLAARHTLVGKSYRDRLALDLSTDAIRDAEGKVKHFETHGRLDGTPMGCEVCRRIAARKQAFATQDATYFQDKIKFKVVIASAKDPMIMLDGCSLAVGESGRVRIDGRIFKVKCLEIGSESAMIEVIGLQPPIRVPF